MLFFLLPAKSFGIDKIGTIKSIDSTNSTEQNNKFHYQGWVPKELIPDDMLVNIVPKVCNGSYFIFENRFNSEIDNLYITGDSSTIDPSGMTRLDGNVHAWVNDTQLFADSATVDRQSGIITAEDRVRIYHQGLNFFGDSFWINSNTGEMRMNNVGFVSPASRQSIDVSVLTRDELGVYYLKEGSYTTCEPGDEAWRVYGSDIYLDFDNGWGSIVGAIIYVQDVPVFYFPWLHFPLDERRRTGLLLPDIMFADNGFYEQPVYLNLAPNLDATLYPRYYSERGLLSDGEVRLLTKYTNNRVTASGISDDVTKSWRSRKGFYHTGGFNLPYQTRIDYTSINDPLYYDDLNLSLFGNDSSFLKQTAEVTANFAPFGFRAGSYDLQPIGDSNSTGYARLPEGEIRFSDRFGLLLAQGFSIYSEYVPRRLLDFTTAEIVNGDKVSAQRRHDQISVGLILEEIWGYAKSQVYFYNTNYSQQDQIEGIEPEIDRQLQSVSVDLGLVFDRQFIFNEATYSQTLEPRVFFVNTPFFDQNDIPLFGTSEPRFSFNSLFRINRFDGYDRIGDSQDVSISTITKIKNDLGYELFSFGIGARLYGNNRKVTLERNSSTAANSITYRRDVSPIASQVRLAMESTMRLTWNYTYDQQIGKSRLNRWNFQHKPSSRTVYNLGYSQVLEQFSNELESEDVFASAAVQITDPIALFGRYFFDIESSLAEETLAGIEYESCCWRIRLGALQRLESTDNADKEFGVFFQFYFKGLTGANVSTGDANSNDLDSELGKKIPGFSNRALYLPD